MVFLIRPILLRFLRSKGVKTLVVELLEAYAKTTDNTIDDQVVKYVKSNLFPSSRIEK